MTHQQPVLTKTFAPNGVIFAAGATVRLQGVVSGNYTIGTSTETTAITTGKKKKKITSYVTTGGDIYLDDDIVYKSDPNKNPNSTDMLGIVAENNVFVADNKANRSDINIDAAIFAQYGGFGAENYDHASSKRLYKFKWGNYSEYTGWRSEHLAQIIMVM